MDHHGFVLAWRCIYMHGWAWYEPSSLTMLTHQPKWCPFTIIEIIESNKNSSKLQWTRTTRTPALWGYPPPPNDYPYHWVILDPKSEEDKVKVTNLKIFWILKRALHETHLLKLLDKMCKYEMDPMSIVEDTERTLFCPQTDRRTDGQTDKVIPVYPPFNFVEAGV